VIVTGNSGSGKSVMAFYVACHLEKTRGFLVYPALKPGEIVKVHLPGSNQLFLFDDLFGNSMSEYAISRWEMEAESIKYLLTNNPNVKILMTCKSDMYKVEKIRSLGISLTHFDLSSHDQRLTLAERKGIAKLYLSNETVQQLDDNVIMLYRFFPLLCYMFGKNKLTNTDFFEKPLAVVEGELKNMKEKHDDSFIVIGLLIVLNNKIDKELLETGDKAYVSIIDDLVTFLRFNHRPTIGNLLTSLHGLIPTYIEETKCSYTFIHDKVFNVVLYCVGHSLVRCILKHSDASFIGSRLQLENIGERRNDVMLASGEERIYFDKHLQEMKCDSNREILIKSSIIKSSIQPENEGPRTNITIIVSSKDENLYFDRLFQEIKCGFNWEVFNNIHTQFTDYRKHFIYYLRQKTDVKFMISPKDGSSALHVSSARGYVEFVEYIIEKDKSQIYSIDNKGKTPLHIASIYGHHDIVRLLVCNGSPVDHKDRYNVTSLIFSCFHGQINVVRILLEHKVIVNPVNKDEWIPLHIACEKGHNDIVDLLLKTKAKVNKLNKTGLSSLYIACSNGHTDIAKSLIRHGADVCRRNTSGTTPLHIACQNGHVAVVKLLLENKARLNIREYDGSTPLNKACRYSQKEVVKLLLQFNANVNTELQDGCTPLHTVCDTGNADIAQMLLNFMASVNIEMRDGWTPLHKVSMRGHTDVASALLRYNADINQGNKKKGNITPLHIACGYGNISFVSLLLEHKPIVNKMDDNGCIPLHVASEHGHQDVVELLLDRGALINIPNKNGSTPLYLSVQNGHTSTTESLIKHKASVNQGNKKGTSPLYVACQKGYSELVNLLLKNNSTINKGNVDNKTPMHVICETGRLDLLSLILNYNDTVELNATTLLDKLTPMHLACMNGHEALIARLLAHADHKKLDVLSMTDKNGHTPLYYAYSSKYPTLIQYLLRNGAKMSPTDRNIKMSDREGTKETPFFSVDSLLKKV
jgi:ankyrin repeat protein